MIEKDAIKIVETEKNSWEPIRLAPLGKATSLIQGGSGKVSLTGGDPGDSRKQSKS